MRRYKRLWRESERDRREADAALREANTAVREMGQALMGILDLAQFEDHPNPEVRGKARQIRREVQR